MQVYSIKELRARKNVTQKQAAEALGVSLPTYNRWENSVNSMKISQLKNLAAFYGVPIREIKLV